VRLDGRAGASRSAGPVHSRVPRNREKKISGGIKGVRDDRLIEKNQLEIR